MAMRVNGFGDLFQEMNRFQEEFNRLFRRAGVGSRWAAAGPAANVWADDHAVYVEFDLPGVDPAKLDISVTEGNRLVVQGERPEVAVENAVWHRQERGHGTFARELTLPTLVDADKVEAKYENGVLRLTLPKAEAAKPRKITVRS
jgi:HSP20 family protein